MSSLMNLDKSPNIIKLDILTTKELEKMTDEEILIRFLEKHLPRTGLKIKMSEALASEMSCRFSPLYESTLFKEFKRMFNVEVEVDEKCPLDNIEILGFMFVSTIEE